MISLLSLLDDIASTLDDISVMTKIALKKTSAIMSDDLAVNSAVVHGSPAARELPIVKAIFIGSLLNKLYCIVGILVLSAISELIIAGILLVGGLYLSFEGAHKVYEKIFDHTSKAQLEQVSEAQKIKGAIRTDLVLSVEIMVIAKSALTGGFLEQLLSLVLVGLAASALIYGLVALLVKVDDLGVLLTLRGHLRVGMILVQSMPKLMRGLGIVGTVAMFLVGGGIVSHTFHLPYYTYEFIQNLIIGFGCGLICLAIQLVFLKIKSRLV